MGHGEVKAASSIDEFVGRAAKLRDSGRRTILGVAGPPGAGKSTFANALVKQLNDEMPGATSLLPMDGYHLPNSVLDERALRSVKGAPQTFDVDAYVELLRNVGSAQERDWHAPGFSRVTDEPVPNGYLVSAEVRLVVTEGNYLLMPGPWAAVRPLCQEIWFLQVDPAIEERRLIRRQRRDNGRSAEDAVEFVKRSDMANARLINEQSTPADLVIQLTEGAL